MKKKKYECEICGREFLHYGRYEVHKSFHKGIKYKCNEDECEFEDQKKATIEEHQKETGHTGISSIETLDNYVSSMVCYFCFNLEYLIVNIL